MNPPNFSNNYLFPWLHNSLYDDNYVQHLLNVQIPNDFTHNLHTCLQRAIIAAQNTTNNEAQLEDEFVKPLLEQLGWHSVKQLGLTAQGKFQELDWALTLSDNAAHTLKASREPQHITAILECKAASIALDNGKANASNPHFQLMQYLNMFKVAYGFLTNGALWRFYDNNALHSKKAYLEFNLTELLAIVDADEQARAVALFALYFAKASYEPTVDGAKTNIQSTATRAADYAFELESNLKSVIYGTDGEDSLFERIGQAIYTASPSASLEQVYENAMVLLYRLLFIVYFEDNNRSLNALLLTLHSDWAAFEPLAALFDVKRDDLPKTDEQYDRLRYQNDKLVAECYGLNPADLCHILKGFPVMLNKRSEYGTLFG